MPWNFLDTKIEGSKSFLASLNFYSSSRYAWKRRGFRNNPFIGIVNPSRSTNHFTWGRQQIIEIF